MSQASEDSDTLTTITDEGGVPEVAPLEHVELALAMCGAGDQQRRALIAQGFNSLEDFRIFGDRDIGNMVSNMNKMPINRGANIGAILALKLKALVKWCKERHRNGLALDGRDFLPNELERVLENISLDQTEDETTPELPQEFKTNKWVSWSKKLENDLWQVKGKNDTPLYYVIRKDRGPDVGPYETTRECRIYQVTLRGAAHQADNHRVFEVLTQLLTDTPAWTWITRFAAAKNGRAAMKALRDHYDGPGEREKRTTYAYSELDNATYRSEKYFSSEKYVTKLSEAFEILEENGMPKPDREKVDYLLKGIQSQNQTVISALAHILLHPPELRGDFQQATDRLSELISSTLTRATGQGSRPARQVSFAQGTKSGKGANSKKKVINGIDVSNRHQSFAPKDWFSLPEDVRKEILDARKKAKGERQKRKAAAASTSNAAQEDDSGGSNDDEAESPDGNGGNFGSGAYGGKGGKKKKGKKG